MVITIPYKSLIDFKYYFCIKIRKNKLKTSIISKFHKTLLFEQKKYIIPK